MFLMCVDVLLKTSDNIWSISTFSFSTAWQDIADFKTALNPLHSREVELTLDTMFPLSWICKKRLYHTHLTRDDESRQSIIFRSPEWKEKDHSRSKQRWIRAFRMNIYFCTKSDALEIILNPYMEVHDLSVWLFPLVCTCKMEMVGVLKLNKISV